MGSSFKIGSFNAIDTNEEKKSSKNGGNDDLKKKLLMLGAIILVGAVVIGIVLFLVSAFSNKTYSYDQIEKVMTSAAENYFEDHPNRLPQNENQRVEIDVDTLVASEYMKPMTEYTGEELSCTGSVAVQTNGDGYLYIPRLDCGESYITQTLREAITKDVVSEGYGLYEVGDTYVYRGENVNNYLQLDTSLWRIVKVTENDDIMLVLAGDMSESVPWDDRYNTQVGYNTGNNTYSTSRIKDALQELYKTNDEYKTILSDNDRTKLVSFDMCVGKRNTNDTTLDNSVECAEVYEDQKIGLLTAADFMLGSIDPNCKTIVDYSCQNYNYLVTDYKWWLGTAVNGTTNEAYGVSTSGVAENERTSSYMYPRPVVVLDGNVLLKSGKGTLNKPYKIK